MKETVRQAADRVLAGGLISREEALELSRQPLEELCAAADEIRRHFCGSGFDICTIVNAKSGRCPEDCKYCAQSAHYATPTQEYPLMDTEDLVKEAVHHHRQGVLRYSLVTSGRKLSAKELEEAAQSIRAIREKTDLQVCVSFGLLGEEEFRLLKAAGASRVHCNLETSRRFFPFICTTHSYEDKLNTLRAARSAGLSLCSGGILGMGETMEDRVDLALTLRQLGVKSVPVNFLNPIPGTPLAGQELLSPAERRRVIALFRFLLPDASIRLAGGRGQMPDKGEGCFLSGANAAISGDMLTTAGITVETDLALLQKLGYHPALWEG